MLQIIIVNNQDNNSIRVEEIRDPWRDITLSTYDKNSCSIDLSPLNDQINQPIIIAHYITKNNVTTFDYDKVCTLTDVAKDEDGIWSFSYC